MLHRCMKTESQESFNLQETMPLYIPQYILEQPQEAIKQVEWELYSKNDKETHSASSGNRDYYKL